VKYIILNMIMLIVFLFISLPVFSQDEMVLINSDEFGNHERPIVQFPHLKHEEVIDCSDCHHEYDEFGDNIGGDGGYCSECHTQEPDLNPVSLVEAFHIQCKICHAKIAKIEKRVMPQMCGQCHIK
jgi:hypothetical protein